ncbi:MAG: hypothetical protein M0T84_01720, partial [Betaproteobacteria bacterium]|nr:hypothetical protein [Betaproteobacteria bacterium]
TPALAARGGFLAWNEPHRRGLRRNAAPVRNSHYSRSLAGVVHTFIEADRASWSNFGEVGLYQLTAEAIKAAFRHGLIAQADLWGSDDALWKKLQEADHGDVSRWVRRITPGTRFTWNDERPLFRLAAKVRSIDPPVVHEDSAIPLSAMDPGFARYRREYLASKEGLWPMALVDAPAGRT